MNTAITENELMALIDKYRRGEYVLWDELQNEAQAHLVRFRGVGRINKPQKRVKDYYRNITPEKRYQQTLEGVAALFGITRKTLDGWINSGLVTLNKIEPPKRMRARYKRVYDSQDLLKQIDDHIKSNKS